MTHPSRPEATGAYAELEKRFARLHHLSGAAGVLHWDMSTMMPKGGAGVRADQLATLSALSHQLLTSADVTDDIREAETQDLNDWQRANLAEIKRIHTRATALDEDLVERIVRASSACEQVWRNARPKGDFAAVLPHLETLLELVREKADRLSATLGLSPYDALLNEYEPDGRAQEIDEVFAEVEAFLPEFLGQVLEKQARSPAPKLPWGPFTTERQKALATELMADIGFDFDHGRLDVSLHPFCGGVAEDVRITTRYDEQDFTSALMGVLHETGHALYDRGLPTAWSDQPVGQARGMSIHESQSLLVEMQLSRSPAFLAFALPKMARAFGGKGHEWELDNMIRLYNRVEPGFIRVDADEVTYPAHVILRYRLERALIAGEMKLPDLPGTWNEMMQKMLGITPPSDAEGCLQDIHWFDGAWGYFPTYTLGAIAAAQFFQTAIRSDPAIEAGVPAGDFLPLLGWLRKNVHGWGSRLSTRELLIQATGRSFDVAAFKAHLHKRYLD